MSGACNHRTFRRLIHLGISRHALGQGGRAQSKRRWRLTVMGACDPKFSVGVWALFALVFLMYRIHRRPSYATKNICVCRQCSRTVTQPRHRTGMPCLLPASQVTAFLHRHRPVLSATALQASPAHRVSLREVCPMCTWPARIPRRTQHVPRLVHHIHTSKFPSPKPHVNESSFLRCHHRCQVEAHLAESSPLWNEK